MEIQNCVYHSLKGIVIAVEVNRKGIRCATCGNISHAKEGSRILDTILKM